jgi:hypothetical protein
MDLNDRTALLGYLLVRLTQAQGFSTYTSTGKVTESGALLLDTTKKARQAKRGAAEIRLHRFYGKGPQEGSSSVTVVLHTRLQDNVLTLDELAVEVSTPVCGPKGTRGEDVTTVTPTINFKETWMALDSAIQGYRRFRPVRAW